VDLMKVVRDSAFEKRSLEERTAIYAAIGSTNQPVAFSFFTQLLAAKPTLLNKKRVLDDKLLAIAGLAGAGTITGLKLLQQLVEDKTQPTEILVASRKAIYQVRRQLFGESAEGAA
jgi:hypothetical protein